MERGALGMVHWAWSVGQKGKGKRENGERKLENGGLTFGIRISF